jgi:hypothetical protein
MQRSALIVVGVVIVAALVGAVGTGAAQSDENVVTLTINTVVESSNQQIGGVTLVASWDDGETTVTTASNGKAFVDVPEGATVEITLDDDEYTRNQPYRIRVATEKEHTVDIARKAEVDIVVNDGEGPVADARVALSQDGTTIVSGRTDSDGRFQSGTVAQGTYTVSAVKPGYYRTTDEIIVAGSPEMDVRIERGRVDYDIVVEDPHFDTARSVSDATVSIQGVGELTTDDRGAAASLLPVNTDVQVTVSKDGYESTTRTISVDEGSGTAVFRISRPPSLSLTAVNQRIVVGEVVPVEVTNAYDEPAEGVTVLYDGEPVGQTNAEGRLTVQIDSTGEHEISARRGGTTSDVVTVTGIEGAAGDGATTAAETETPASGTTVASGDSGLGLDGLLPIVALVVVLLLLVVLALVFVRRRRSPEPDPEFGFADDGTASSGTAGTDTVVDPTTGAGPTAGAETGAGSGADAGAGAESGAGSGTGTGADAGVDSDAGADTDAGEETNTGSDTSAAPDTETDSGSEGGSESATGGGNDGTDDEK